MKNSKSGLTCCFSVLRGGQAGYFTESPVEGVDSGEAALHCDPGDVTVLIGKERFCVFHPVQGKQFGKMNAGQLVEAVGKVLFIVAKGSRNAA